MNNKGITLTEIIISIALISIVLIFMFSLLVNVNGINKESDVNSTYLIGKSLVLKSIEEDFRKASSVKIKTCNINSIYSTYGNNILNEDNTVKEYYFSYKTKKNEEVSKLKGKICYEFIYGENDIGRLGIYYYDKRDSYVISYIHNDIKATRLLPDFEKYNVSDDGDYKFNVEIKPNGYALGTNIYGFFSMKIPIIGSDEKDYSIIISYYGK